MALVRSWRRWGAGARALTQNYRLPARQRLDSQCSSSAIAAANPPRSSAGRRITTSPVISDHHSLPVKRHSLPVLSRLPTPFLKTSVDALFQAPYASTTATARGIRLDARLRDVGSCSESRPNRIAMPMGLRIVRTPLGSCQQSSWNWTMLWDVLDQLYSD